MSFLGVYISACMTRLPPIGCPMAGSSQNLEEEDIFTGGWQGTGNLGLHSHCKIYGPLHQKPVKAGTWRGVKDLVVECKNCLKQKMNFYDVVGMGTGKLHIKSVTDNI
ncbi:hypothetical protein AB205_0105150 [Aquarana catesbeiana]|uniref:Uncharacterized protein n=1 Tax=Aquarana catesbeiana TaxID=8400 RepID=A0A2G9SCE2_AQUCT|nr:hypothetical protein AB205_0105150 [Aquarana catesbeiana]